jgi:endonuclease/exonuclease/phosphatase family metal-dependent hydrolase
MPHTIKILTYNIHKGFSAGNRRFILHDIKASLQQLNTDVVFLQEIQGEHNIRQQKIATWPNDTQFEFLADEVWDHHAYGKNAIYKSGHHGNAILSKYPFIEWENINVSNIRSASRSLLHGIIKIPSKNIKIHLICVHLGLFSREREKQLSVLSRRINSHVPHNEALIIAGDFNDWLCRAEKHLQQELGLREIFKHSTGTYARSFPAWMPMLNMDRIYFRGLLPMSCEKLHLPHWKKLSDHNPLIATFSLPVNRIKKLN